MSTNSALYDSDFYTQQGSASDISARAMVPFLAEALKPRSMVDIGCGMGFWPRAFAQAGVPVCHGVDGAWTHTGTVLTPGKDLFEYDFGQAEMPFSPSLPQARYDLVTSFEFVEHIAPGRADALVDLFCSLADIVALGGAIPHQSGVYHVNEQWADYWSEKFAARGYACCDLLRPVFWDNPEVEPWYAQNTLVYFKGEVPAAISEQAGKAWAKLATRPARIVHPDLWDYAHPPLTVRRAAFNLARAVKRAAFG